MGTRLQVAAKVTQFLKGRVSRGFAMLLLMPLTLVRSAPEPNKKVNLPLPDYVTLALYCGLSNCFYSSFFEDFFQKIVANR
jgi:hypothetical protein